MTMPGSLLLIWIPSSIVRRGEGTAGRLITDDVLYVELNPIGQFDDNPGRRASGGPEKNHFLFIEYVE